MTVQHRGSNWTPDEDQRLLDLVKDSKSCVVISANLKRPAKSAPDRFAYLRSQAKNALDGKLGLKAKGK
jgi:hypothetical protein